MRNEGRDVVVVNRGGKVRQRVVHVFLAVLLAPLLAQLIASTPAQGQTPPAPGEKFHQMGDGEDVTEKGAIKKAHENADKKANDRCNPNTAERIFTDPTPTAWYAGNGIWKAKVINRYQCKEAKKQSSNEEKDRGEKCKK